MNFLLALIFSINLVYSGDITFIANEGNYGASNGSISMIFEDGSVVETEPLGDVVQALEVYGNKLIVLINNSHKIKIYDITSNGLAMPGIEISTNGSGPRDLVIINDKVYFTNYNSQDIKIFNLYTYSFESPISVNGLPEDIEIEPSGNYLWVTVPHSDSYFSTGNHVLKIDINTNSIVETIDAGPGPQQIAFLNEEVFISRTYYDANWSTFHGTTKIVDNNFDGISEVELADYGMGVACGGSVVKHQNSVYRSFGGGLAKINQDLSLDNVSIGDFDQSAIYHVEKIGNNFWFAITNFNDINQVHVLDENGTNISLYESGIIPGDFAIWIDDTELSNSNELPKDFIIENIYPNPFNPSTTISFSLSSYQKIDLSVYNINGKLIQNIYSGYKHPGSYSMEWNAKAEPSGMYLIKMKSKSFLETQKVMLVK
tara:strand:- start:3537 stop:4823 length:1287 start_codon:yes stop_codon:yes gene_type:complete